MASSMIKRPSDPWILKGSGYSSGGGVTITDASANEILVVASASDGSKYCRAFPLTLSGYIVIEYLDANYIRVYSNGAGTINLSTASYTYDIYYR